MVNIVHFLKQFFTSATLSTGKTSNATPYCRIVHNTSLNTPTDKPLGFVVSHEKSFYELVLIARTVTTLQKEIGVLPEIHIFCAQNSQQILNELCFDHFRKNPHGLSALGVVAPWLAAHCFSELTMNGFHSPLLFANVHEPHKLGIRNHSWVAGVSSMVQSYTKQLETIKILKPRLQRVIIPHDTLLHTYYSSGTNIEYGNIAAFTKECRRQNIKPVHMGVTPADNIARNLREYNSEETMFMITREPTVLHQTEEIIATCNKQGIAAFSDLPLPTLHGAAFGSGDSGIAVVKSFANIVKKVICERKLPGKLLQPQVVESNRLLYNGENLAAQGVKIDTPTKRLLEAQDIMVVADNEEYIL